MSTRAPRSVLDDLGAELTGIVAPTSLCMVATLAVTNILNPNGESDTNAVWLAQAVYSEQDGASAASNFVGALLNSIVFVLAVAFMTFLLALCFKHGCMNCIKAYMGAAGFSIYFVLSGLVTLELLQKSAIPLDVLSFLSLLANFAMVGSLTLFFLPAPLTMKQGYLIWTGVVTAFVFSWLPPWTCWVLLVAMACYDLVAVLMPGGPLKMLVELAEERSEPIPALVFEGRPVHRVTPQPADVRDDTLALSDASVRLPVQVDAYTNPRDLSSSATEMQRDEETLALLRRPDFEAEDEFLVLPDSIKLGLGDFIFYSLLLVRATQSGGCVAALGVFLATLAGLGCTLVWLGLAQKALPALPISIGAALLCYALIAFVLQQVLLPSATVLVLV